MVVAARRGRGGAGNFFLVLDLLVDFVVTVQSGRLRAFSGKLRGCEEADQHGEVADVAAVLVVVVGLLLLDGAAATAGPLPAVSMVDRRWRRIVVVVAAVEDDDASLVPATAASFEPCEGGALALPLQVHPVVARPFEGRFIVERLLLDGLRLHDGEPRLRLDGGEARLRLGLDKTRRSRGGGTPAALVDDDAGAAGAPAERRLRGGLCLDAEERRRAGRVGGGVGGGGGGESPGHPRPGAPARGRHGHRGWVCQRRVIAALEVHGKNAWEGTLGPRLEMLLLLLFHPSFSSLCFHRYSALDVKPPKSLAPPVPPESSAHALAMARSRQTLSWIRSSYSLHASVHLYSFPLEGDPSPAPSTRFSDEVRVCTRRAMDVDIKGLSLPSTSSTSGFSCGSDAGCCTSSWWSCPSACRSSLHYSATFDSTNAFGQILLEEDEHGNTPISFPQPHVRISTECDAKSLKHRSRPPDPECRRWILSQSRLQSRTGTASCALPRLQRSSAHAVDAVVISASFECVWIWSLHCLPIVFIVLG
nr:uncharacterized protein LOC109783661 [Aegilops tauschii subsp. strangulata]